ERPKEHASKACEGASPPWVQIPPPPPCDVSGHRNGPDLHFVGPALSCVGGPGVRPGPWYVRSRWRDEFPKEFAGGSVAMRRSAGGVGGRPGNHGTVMVKVNRGEVPCTVLVPGATARISHSAGPPGATLTIGMSSTDSPVTVGFA